MNNKSWRANRPRCDVIQGERTCPLATTVSVSLSVMQIQLQNQELPMTLSLIVHPFICETEETPYGEYWPYFYNQASNAFH